MPHVAPSPCRTSDPRPATSSPFLGVTASGSQYSNRARSFRDFLSRGWRQPPVRAQDLESPSGPNPARARAESETLAQRFANRPRSSGPFDPEPDELSRPSPPGRRHRRGAGGSGVGGLRGGWEYRLLRPRHTVGDSRPSAHRRVRGLARCIRDRAATAAPSVPALRGCPARHLLRSLPRGGLASLRERVRTAGVRPIVLRLPDAVPGLARTRLPDGPSKPCAATTGSWATGGSRASSGR